MSKIKTFRGLMADGAQETIHLKTLTGRTGYKINKFQIFPNKPGTAEIESTCMVFKTQQTSVSTSTATVDFSNQTLLAVAYIAEGQAADQGPLSLDAVVFDREIFNQDIFITHTATKVSESVNYYMELEQISLDSNETAVATLKNIKNRG